MYGIRYKNLPGGHQVNASLSIACQSRYPSIQRTVSFIRGWCCKYKLRLCFSRPSPADKIQETPAWILQVCYFLKTCRSMEFMFRERGKKTYNTKQPSIPKKIDRLQMECHISAVLQTVWHGYLLILRHLLRQRGQDNHFPKGNLFSKGRLIILKMNNIQMCTISLIISYAFTH